MRRVLLGHIPVDSGGVVVSDPAYLSRWQTAAPTMDETYRLCQLAGAENLNDMIGVDPPELPYSEDASWVARCSAKRGGMLGEQHIAETADGKRVPFASGVAATTGMGDGLYPVYALVTEKQDVDEDFAVGRVAAVIVDCELSKGIDLMWQLIERQAEKRLGESAEGN